MRTLGCLYFFMFLQDISMEFANSYFLKGLGNGVFHEVVDSNHQALYDPIKEENTVRDLIGKI